LIFLVAAVLLSVERIFYVWVWQRPEIFRMWTYNFATGPSLSTPVIALQKFFYGFKMIQLAVFAGWCFYYGSGSPFPTDPNPLALALGGTLILAGQFLNLSVFYRLGSTGVFYGNQFGYEIEWCKEFPFSLLDHPQYVGALLSIWGFFLAIRFPHPDWYLLPMLETVYYTVGAHFEQ